MQGLMIFFFFLFSVKNNADTHRQNHQLSEFNFSKRILFRRLGFALPLDTFITCIRQNIQYHLTKLQKKNINNITKGENRKQVSY
jgi:hypothetical protein